MSIEKQRDYYCLVTLRDSKTCTLPNFFFTARVTDAAGWKDKKKGEMYPERDGHEGLREGIGWHTGEAIIIVSGWRRGPNDILFKKQSGNSSLQERIDNAARDR